MKEVWTMADPVSKQLVKKLRVTKSRSVYSQNIWHQAVINEPFRRLHVTWVSGKVKALQIQIQWEYDQYEPRLHSEQYIEKAAMNTYNWSHKK
jgi:hypothetical protein